jgi:hypothetical protein
VREVVDPAGGGCRKGGDQAAGSGSGAAWSRFQSKRARTSG